MGKYTEAQKELSKTQWVKQWYNVKRAEALHFHPIHSQQPHSKDYVIGEESPFSKGYNIYR